MQTVRRGQVAGAQIAAPDRLRVLADRAHLGADDPRPGGLRGFGERGVQFGAPHPHARTGAELGARRPATVGVGDTGERLAVHHHSERLKMTQCVRHQTLAAGLVDGSAPTVEDHHLQPRAGGVRRGGQTGRATAGDQQVDHDSLAKASFSTRIRVVSRTALRTVNTSAVIQAVCTRGSATPSAMTAT